MRLALFTLSLICVGCMSQEERQAELARRAEIDRAYRREHMRNAGAVRDSEYDTLNKNSRDFTPQASGIPSAPTTEELERRVKETAR